MAKENGVVLVSPAGNEHRVANPVTEHNLRARGYTDKPARRKTPAAAAPRPVPRVEPDTTSAEQAPEGTPVKP
jgi:hypothetical protein